MDQVEQLLTHESGLLAHFRPHRRHAGTAGAGGVRRARRLAVDIFCYQVRKWIGAFAAALGGLDTLVFSGGIGEHAPPVRARICGELSFLGVELDDCAQRRQRRGRSRRPRRRVRVRVIADQRSADDGAGSTDRC